MGSHENQDENRCERCGTTLSSGTCPRCISALLFGGTQEFSEPFEAAPFRRLGEYDLIEEVSRGGMGIVYRARQRSLNREVAVKLMRDSALARPEDVRRFRAEAASAARLKHPHIVAIYEVGEVDGQHFFVMDLVAGVNLAERAREGPLPVREAAELVVQIAEAVQHAHEQGILHRDLKPSNVLVNAVGQAFVTDFGLARPLDVESSLTVTGQVLGTPGYIPPEQATGRGSVGPAADIYSLGALLYHLLTGRAPFVGASIGETLRQVLEQEPVSPRILNAQAPVDLTSVCLKCLAKRPAERYESAKALAEDVRRFLRGESTLARPAGQTERLVRWVRRKPALATAMAAAGLAASFGFIGIIWQWQRAEHQRETAEANALAARQNVYAADMLITQQSLVQGAVGQAVDMLLLHEPKRNQQDFRGWEWWYLGALCLQRIETNGSTTNFSNSVSGGAEPVFAPLCVPVFAPDNRTIAYGNKDGDVDWWDAVTGKVRGTIRAGGMNPLGFADGGRTLIIAKVKTPLPLEPNEFGGVEFWDIESRTMKPSWNVGLQSAVVGAVSLSPDGTFVATGDLKGNVTLRNASDGKLVKELPAGKSRVWNLVFSPDSSVLVVGMQEEMKLWTITTERVQGIGGVACAAAFSPDGKLLVTSSYRRVQVYQTATGKFLNGFQTDFNSWLAISNDGKTLVCASRSVELWNLASRRRLTVFLPDFDAQFVRFSPDGQRLIGGKVGEMHVWTAANETEMERVWSSSAPYSSEPLPKRDPSRIPPRDSRTPRNLIDLSAYYNAALGDSWMGSPRDDQENSLGQFKAGMQTLAGVPFDARGIVQLGSRQGYPRRVSGIPVGLTCRNLHFLHATLWGELRSESEVGRYVVHFASGRRVEIPITLGQDIFEWSDDLADAPKGSLTVAWTGSNESGRIAQTERHLFKKLWKNPWPDQVIQSIDFVWAGTPAQPFLVAITAEQR